MAKQHNNITLIGMPASGKSTIGVLLAKRLGYSFVDVDIVIQEQEKRLLKEIIEDEGLSVIAPGGSVIYGKEAMEHLKEIGLVVYLKLSYEDLKVRLGNLVDRGVVLKEGMTLLDLYNERVPYYEKYADITICEDGCEIEDTIENVLEEVKKLDNVQ